MNNQYIIYCYTNIINGKKYIGQTKRSIQQRSGKEGYYYLTKCPAFGNAIKKYGWENFNVEILKEQLSLEQANYWEQYYINYYHTWIDDPMCNGYNLQKGGNNRQQSTQTKQKISKTKKEKMTQQTKKKISQCQKALWQNEEYRKKQIQSHKNLHPSQQTRKKMSIAQKKRFSTQQAKRQKSLSSQKAVRCIQTGKQYSSVQQAALDVGLKTGGDIGRVCNKKRKTAGKYRWEWINNI